MRLAILAVVAFAMSAAEPRALLDQPAFVGMPVWLRIEFPSNGLEASATRMCSDPPASDATLSKFAGTVSR
jgi:hypothetical protein